MLKSKFNLCLFAGWVHAVWNENFDDKILFFFSQITYRKICYVEQTKRDIDARPCPSISIAEANKQNNVRKKEKKCMKMSENRFSNNFVNQLNRMKLWFSVRFREPPLSYFSSACRRQCNEKKYLSESDIHCRNV